MACSWRHHGRGRLLLAAAVMSSIQHANAAPFPVSSSPTAMAETTILGANDADRSLPLPPKSRSSSHRRRRRILSKISSMRGGSTSSGGSRGALGLGGAGGIGDGNSDKIMEGGVRKIDVKATAIRNRGGSIRPSSILSTAVMIVAESLSVASAALVLSGYFGAWVASWMVGKLSTLATSGVNVGGGESNNHPLLGKYRRTTLATVGFLLMHALGGQDKFSRASDSSFVALLWIHSRIVDPVLGGAIGIAHVSLGFLSAVLENPRLADLLDGLGKVRLKRLGQYVEGEDDPYVSPGEGRIDRTPVATGGPRGEVGAAIANWMGSVSMLLSFPQHCLGLYLLGSSLVVWSSTKKFDGVWKGFRKWTRWLGEGMCIGRDEGGDLRCGIDGAAAAIGSVASERIDVWKLSKRLVALYWVLALAKATVAYAVL